MTEFDVVVVGSGAAGMTAALAAADAGLSVVVVEKAAKFGGSTARSGGGVWIPGNEALRAAGVDDTAEDARKYLEHLVGGQVDPERVEAYLQRGPEVLSFLCRVSPLRMRWVPGYSDYFPEAPGGKAGGRTVEPALLNGKILGADLADLEPDYGKSPPNLVVTQADFRWLSIIGRHPRGIVRLMRIAGRWLRATALRQRLLSKGQALSAALMAGLQRAGVPVWLDSPLLDLRVEGGRVTGVRVLRDGAETTVSARRGVVLAGGGFEHNETMRKQYQREPIGTEWTVGAKANTGDAIAAGQRVGAAVEFMDDAWWGPSIPLTGEPWFCLAERTLPGSIMVNDRGRRFVNEATPYVEATHAMYGGQYGQGGANPGPGENIPAWLVFDQRYRNRYIFAGLFPRQPLPGRWFKSGVLASADSVAELAERIGVPSGALQETVERFNGFAQTGVDEDFHRGESQYDRYYGDPRNRPNPSVGALVKPPFYAARMVPGDLGTKGGLRTDARARVLTADGSPIAGLYAAGNCSSPVMGHTYAGPGATIGPAMVFGYLAAEDLAEKHGGVS